MDLANAAIVVAHPDDEVLWFAGALPHVRRAVLCYGDFPPLPEIGAQRRRLVDSYPSANIEFLDIPEPRTKPMQGLRKVADVERVWPLQSEKDCTAFLAQRLNDSLRDGVSAILTHNAWGEYGHPSHKRVNRAIHAVAEEKNIPVYVSGFASLRVLSDCAASLDAGVAEIFEAPIRLDFAQAIQKHYATHSCWTWNDDWRWPESDCYLRLGQGGLANFSAALRVFDWPQKPAATNRR